MSTLQPLLQIQALGLTLGSICSAHPAALPGHCHSQQPTAHWEEVGKFQEASQEPEACVCFVSWVGKKAGPGSFGRSTQGV